jgi:hypothetical protein
MEGDEAVIKEPHVTLMHAWLVLEKSRSQRWKNFTRRFVRTNEIHIQVQHLQGEKV